MSRLFVVRFLLYELGTAPKLRHPDQRYDAANLRVKGHSVIIYSVIHTSFRMPGLPVSKPGTRWHITRL